MASTSTSSIQKSFKYDVFLSFRGEDTRKNFVDHLYHALKQKGIKTYKDDKEIKKGKRIADQLFSSIEDSKFYIIVFSKNYASSSWCLEELVKIMECQKTIDHVAYPVFYDVEPTEVRKQSGAVGEAISKHTEEEEIVGKWREALREAADLAGWEVKTTFDGHESKLIQKVIEEISLGLCFISSNGDGKLVGMETRVQDVVSTLETDMDDVRVIGIKGMGGGGKTTLARAVFDQISIWFEGSSFVENVRETSKNPLFGLKSLQKQVLSDVLNDKDINVNGVYEGKKMMKQKICRRKVLIVLDDVDHIDQLEALVGESNWFKLGSRIIITTREEQVLVAHGVPMNLILDVNLLSPEEASCLFNKNAFGKEISNQGYEIISRQVVEYAAGLPLTIKVLGSYLGGKDELEWIDAVERLKTIPLKETLEILELSYKSLEEDCKEIFLDVTCLLKGWKKEHAITSLESCGFHGRNGLRVLEQKSLITVSGTGHLSMHDHIEEMGKNIVRRLHPNEPHKHSRLWIGEEIEDVFVEDKGTEATRCIQVRNVDPVIVMKGVRKMKGLRFLDVICELKVGFWFDDADDYNDIGEDSLYLPNGLHYLSWDGYPFTCLPNNFQANNLVGLQMFYSGIYQLWKGGENKVLKKLRFIHLSFCKLRTLDIGLITNLESLNLEYCWNLVELHMPVESIKLKFLKLHHVKLKTLDLTCTDNLETLDLACENLVELYMPVENFKLKSFHLCYSKLRTLDIGKAQYLDELNITDNDELVELHLPTEKLKPLWLQCFKLRMLNLTQTRNLEKLGLIECEELQELYMPIECREIKIIYIKSCQLRTVDLTRTRNLENLILIDCKSLQELYMPIESLKLKIICIRSSKLRMLNLKHTRNLEKLDLIKCEDFQELYMPIECHEIKIIYIHSCKLRTLDLTRTQNLENLDLIDCKGLQELYLPTESPKLKIINICSSKLRTLDLMSTRNLEKLDLIACKGLQELYLPTESTKLNNICIHSSKLRTLDLMFTRNLEKLDLKECEGLQELYLPPESPELRIIYIYSSKLRTLHLTQTRNLEDLYLSECGELEELCIPVESPELKSIYIHRSKLRTLNLIGARNLEYLRLYKCGELRELCMPIESPMLKEITIHSSKLRTLSIGLQSPCLSGYVEFKPFLLVDGFPMAGSLAELHLIVRSLGICPLHPDNNLPKFLFECIYNELLLTLSHPQFTTDGIYRQGV